MPKAPAIKRMRCKRCGHTWFPRQPGRPRRCPQCHVYSWDRPKPKPVTCKACGMSWSPYVPKPKKCTYCFQPLRR